MVTITANEAVQAAFRHVAQRAEIRDTSGTIIGYFEPSEETRKLYEEARTYFDPEDLKKIKESGGPYYTTAEVISYLRSLKAE
jgi:hypothetical protein